MTSKWSKSEDKSTGELKNNYLVQFNGEVFGVTATEKEIKSTMKVLNGVRAWRCIEVEQTKQS